MAANKYRIIRDWLIVELFYESCREYEKQEFYKWQYDTIKLLHDKNIKNVLAIIGKYESDGFIANILNQSTHLNINTWIYFAEDGPLKHVYETIYKDYYNWVDDLNVFMINNKLTYSR